MREFKFRAWNRKTKEMLPDRNTSNKLHAIHSIDYPEIYDVMQYIGIKDKNGVEIYEGDIISFIVLDQSSDIFDNPKNIKIYLEVIYVQNLFCGLDRINESIIDPFGRPSDIEVVGNIYENTELIEVKE